MAFDTRMMEIAIGLARRGLGTTAPNPSVGTVIVSRDGSEVLGRGWTQPGGRPHAEVDALARAGNRAAGATLYTTLEPCSHHGVTAPCADAIIAAGIARVVGAIADPDPRVSGAGYLRLRAAGIDVTEGVCADEAAWLTLGHTLRVTARRPFIQLKMALGPDGRVPRGSGNQPLWVTSSEARAHGHMLRAEADAILVGSGTLRDDDPLLTCRVPGLAGQSPVRVALAGRRELPRSCRIFADSGTPVWTFTSRDFGVGGSDAAGPVRSFTVAAAPDGRPDLAAVANVLSTEGITRLLVEGGPMIWDAFLKAGLVDEIVQYRAGAADTLDVFHDCADQGQTFTLIDKRRIGPDAVGMFRRV